MSMREELSGTAPYSQPRGTEPKGKKKPPPEKRRPITKADAARREERSSAPRKHHLDKRACDLAEQAGEPDTLISTKQLAAWLGTSAEWCEIGRHKDYGPRFLRLGPNIVRYRVADVVAWLRERTFQNTAEYAAPARRVRRSASEK
jgi:hypothetical protein